MNRLLARTVCFAAVFSLFGLARGQGPSAPLPLTSDQVIEKASPSVALVLTGKSSSELNGVGAGIVIQENGILLTVYHLVKDAQAVQVRFKNGETFDDVRLLGVDQRRGVAAIKINATALPVLPLGSASKTKAGDSICVVSHAAALPWTASTGVVSAYRLAEEVPGAGSGYRLLQFTAPTAPGSSGGVVLDAQARALGLIVGSIAQGQNLNFAVPIESVLGLADAPVGRTFASGAALRLPAERAASNESNVTRQKPASSPKTEPQSDDLAKSDVLRSKDPDFILRNFRTMYVDARRAVYFRSDQMKGALGSNKEFTVMRISLVDDPALADVVLEVGYTFAWDYPYALKHQNTSMVLLAGKGHGPFSGPVGATSVANQLTKQLKPYRFGAPKVKPTGETPP